VFAVTVLAVITLANPTTQHTALADSTLLPLRQQVKALAPLAHSDLARQFLAAAADLPPIRTRTIYRDSMTGVYFREADVDSLPEGIRARLVPSTVDALYFYQTHYGTMLNYLRLIDLLGANGVTTFEGKRLLDFGYGRIGHLRAIASLGATAVGVDVDPELPVLYAERGDQGPVRGANRREGLLSIVHGSFPGDSAVRRTVGGLYDLVISRNTLKGGHEPAQRARQSRVINLGVSDSTFVRAIFESMRSDGLFMMYTVSGPKGNAHCPFSEDMVRAVGFQVVAYDQDDSVNTRAMLRVLHRGQGEPPSAPDEESTALYTILRKP
jgi:hypothetical protein